MFTTNHDRIRQLAITIGALSKAPTFNESITPSIDVDHEIALKAYLWSAAICHATKGNLQGKHEGKPISGWDYLLRAFCTEAQSSEAALSTQRMLQINEQDLRRLLEDNLNESSVSLFDLGRRAEILRQCARDLDHNYDGSVLNLLSLCDGYVGGDRGAYRRLSKLEPFQDELRKKSSAFLMTTHFSGRWQIRDQENVLPMIDYHRMRLLLRTGCIEISDPMMRDVLLSQSAVPNTVEAALRSCSAQLCKEAIRINGMAMFDFDVILWAHARSCCRHFPICISHKSENSSFYDYLMVPRTSECVFQKWCPGVIDSRYRDLWEPFTNTEDY